MSKLVEQQACKINWEVGWVRETVLPGKMGEMRGHAGDRNGEETRKEMHATEIGGERQGWVPHICPPIPVPGDKSRPLSTAPMGRLHGIRKFHSLPYQSREPRHLGSLFKV